MKEGLAARVSRIISGSVNAVLDAVESAAPTVILEEAVREIDSAIDDLQNEIRELSANRRMANTRLMEENQEHEELSEKIAVAVGDERDDLARTAIARQLDIEAQIPVLERMIGETSEREKELEGYVIALRASGARCWTIYAFTLRPAIRVRWDPARPVPKPVQAAPRSAP